MFIHDNGKVCVLSATRCGHTSMFEYFGIKPYTKGHKDWLQWMNTKSRRILVLRNPYDRWISARRFDDTDELRTRYNTKYTKEEWLEIHSNIFLSYIDRSLQFEVIKFERLSEYIPKSSTTISTDTNTSHHYEVEITPELKREYLQYRYFNKHCKEIDPTEWKLLTYESDSGILEE